MNDVVDFGRAFARLAELGQRETAIILGGVQTRLVRVAGGAEGRWDSHADTAETVMVWGGDFLVEYRDRTQTLTAGQCCVVPRGVEHRGTSRGGAEIVLFQTL
jgi:mannose-6-phosphate isomerase-like protein (cupin superfamily)